MEVGDEVPEFRDWRAEQLNATRDATVESEDGTAHHLMCELLREARTPAADSGNEQQADAKAPQLRRHGELHSPKLVVQEDVNVEQNRRGFPYKKFVRLHEYKKSVPISMIFMITQTPYNPCIQFSQYINAPHAWQVQT